MTLEGLKECLKDYETEPSQHVVERTGDYLISQIIPLIERIEKLSDLVQFMLEGSDNPEARIKFEEQLSKDVPL